RARLRARTGALPGRRPARYVAHRMRLRPAWWWLLAGMALAAVMADALRYRGYLIDDTFISLRYARNWLAGNGLVFNAGERVEGYTNFLFVVLAAAALRLGLDPIRATKAVSLAAAALTIACTAPIERRGPALWTRPRFLTAAVLLLLPLQAVAYWAIASFETMLFTALVTAAVACLMREAAARHGHWSAVLFALAALTRPEGLYL